MLKYVEMVKQEINLDSLMIFLFKAARMGISFYKKRNVQVIRMVYFPPPNI